MPGWIKKLFGGEKSTPEHTYVIGKTGELVKQKVQLPSYHPQRMLLPYHELREEETSRWKDDPPRALLESEGSTVIEPVGRLLQHPKRMYTFQEYNDFVALKLLDTDKVWRDLCRLYSSATRLERDYIRSLIDEELAWQLLTFSKRAAVFALRSERSDILRDSLIALAIEDLANGDVRDNMIPLGLIYHCARTVCADPREVFEEVAGMSGPPMSLVLTDFIRRPDLDGILNSMGWREVHSSSGKAAFSWSYE